MRKQKQKDVLWFISTGKIYCTEEGKVFSNRTNKFFKGTLAPNGYINISLSGKRFNKYCRVAIHQVVWIFFKGSLPEGVEINHINGVKTDNNIDNLELLTRSQNTSHAYKIGLNKTKLSEKDIPVIRKLLCTKSAAYIGRMFGVSGSAILDIKHNRNWRGVSFAS